MSFEILLNRREFLKRAGAAGAVIGLKAASCSWLPLKAAEHAVQIPGSPSWVDKPMRWAQLTLVEDDPGKFDPQFWFDYFKQTRSDAVCLSAGGCVAYYPTNVPFHHRSQWLGDRDAFGELVTGCRKLDMVVIARTDPHATYDDLREAHPDWIAVDAEGKPRQHWASPEMWVTCGLGPYNFEFMTEIKREIMSRYKVDGIFINRWDGSGMCFCEHCRKNFLEATGHELPRSNDRRDPARRAYVTWRQQRLFQLWRLWDAEVRAINPDSCVIPNTGGGATSSLDMQQIGELAPILIADRQARRGLTPPWANGKNAKEFRATMDKKPIVGIFSVGLEEPYRWKDSVQSEAEIQLWVADGVANGLRPWFTKFSGVLHDKRWLKPVEDLYRRYARWEPYLRNEYPLARIGLVYSQQSAWFYGGNVEDYTHGWYQALIEARLPFEMVHDRLLDAGHLSRFKTLILPNIVALSDAQCRQLREFVTSGGGLVATYETSLGDEWGEQRKDFGLGDLFGVVFKRRLEGPIQNSYLLLESDPVSGKRHPLLTGLESASRIINGTRRVEVEAATPLHCSTLTLIPSYPDLPMEKVYPRVLKTELDQVFLRETGRGRVVYFPWDLDRTFWEVLCTDHFKLLRNAVQWATNEEPPVTVSGPGVLDVTVWRQKRSIAVHLVNLTNPMMMKGPVRELLPIGEQKVRILLPAGIRVKGVRLLAADRAVPFRTDGHELTVTVPSVLDHEIAAVNL
jgi:hypothetical protein